MEEDLGGDPRAPPLAETRGTMSTTGLVGTFLYFHGNGLVRRQLAPVTSHTVDSQIQDQGVRG